VEGEIQHMPSDYPVTEFAQLACGNVAGRVNDQEITVFDSVGFALEDFSALRFLHMLLKEERGGARQIDLVPQLDDPKDLYGGTVAGNASTGFRRSA
jgi:ornithine cyclodeaminase